MIEMSNHELGFENQEELSNLLVKDYDKLNEKESLEEKTDYNLFSNYQENFALNDEVEYLMMLEKILKNYFTDEKIFQENNMKNMLEIILMTLMTMKYESTSTSTISRSHQINYHFEINMYQIDLNQIVCDKSNYVKDLESITAKGIQQSKQTDQNYGLQIKSLENVGEEEEKQKSRYNKPLSKNYKKNHLPEKLVKESSIKKYAEPSAVQYAKQSLPSKEKKEYSKPIIAKYDNNALPEQIKKEYVSSPEKNYVHKKEEKNKQDNDRIGSNNKKINYTKPNFNVGKYSSPQNYLKSESDKKINSTEKESEHNYAKNPAKQAYKTKEPANKLTDSYVKNPAKQANTNKPGYDVPKTNNYIKPKHQNYNSNKPIIKDYQKQKQKTYDVKPTKNYLPTNSNTIKQMNNNYTQKPTRTNYKLLNNGNYMRPNLENKITSLYGGKKNQNSARNYGMPRTKATLPKYNTLKASSPKAYAKT